MMKYMDEDSAGKAAKEAVRVMGMVPGVDFTNVLRPLFLGNYRAAGRAMIGLYIPSNGMVPDPEVTIANEIKNAVMYSDIKNDGGRLIGSVFKSEGLWRFRMCFPYDALGLGSYESRQEAVDACQNWKVKEGSELHA